MIATPAPKKLDALVLGWEGGGNVPPTVGAVRALVERGHRVRVLGDDSMLGEMRRAGARTLPWRRAPNRQDASPQSCFARDWEAPDPISAFVAWAKAIFVGPALLHAEDVVEAARAEKTDVIIGSDLLFGGMIAAEALNLPSALLAANVSLLRLPGHPPFGPGMAPARNEAELRAQDDAAQQVDAMFDGFLPTLNEARARFGLTPLSRTLDQMRPDRLLLATSPAFDFPVPSLPDFIRYVGPILEEPAWAQASPESVGGVDARPLVVVSFSTTYQGQEAALTATLEALANMPVRGVATLGKGLDGKKIAAPENVRIVAGASHDALLARAAAIVTHAGHGTTLRALRAGVPIVALPMGRDQNDNAARIEYHGAGLRLDPSASSQNIETALRRVIEEPHFAANAQRLSHALSREAPSTRRFVEEIEAMMRDQRATSTFQRVKCGAA